MSCFLGCSTSDNEKIFGKYTFDKIIYYSIANSQRPIKEEMAKIKYIIRKDRFEIISPKGKIKISDPIYKKEEMNDDLVQAFNNSVLGFVSISEYKEKYQYSIYEKDGPTTYCLYSLDDELWIASYCKTTKGYRLVYIYKLK
jgi:hypothetical protein